MKYVLLSVLMVFSLMGNVIAQDYIIDDYEFIWHINDIGEVAIDLVKTEEKTTVSLKKTSGFSYGHIEMTLDEAVAMRDALAKTNEMFNAQKGKEGEQEETARVGERYIVIFRTKQDNSFLVLLAIDQQYLIKPEILLERKDAMKLSKALADIEKKLSFLDEQVGKIGM